MVEMASAEARVIAGICGHSTNIAAVADDSYDVQIAIETDCDKIRRFVAPISAVNALEEIALKHDSTILASARGDGNGTCPGCIVAPAVYKTMQAACVLALPAQSSIEIEVVG